MPVKPIPDGYHSVTPYLMATDARQIVVFLKEVFGAVEGHRMSFPDGRIMHTDVRIGDSLLMLSDVCAGGQSTAAGLYVYVPDVDATYKKALAAGATSIMEPMNAFYGDRSGGVRDPQGNMWWIGTHIEDVPPDELARRGEVAMKQMAGK